MIYLEEIDILHQRFTDLSIALKEMSKEKKELEEDTIKSLKDGYISVVDDVLGNEEFRKAAGMSEASAGYAKDLKNRLEKNLGITDQAFVDVSDVFGEPEDLFEQLTGAVRELGEEAAPSVFPPSEEEKKERGPVAGYMAKEGKSVKRWFGGVAGKLKIPRFGGIIAGGIMMMAYGYLDADRVRAEAGEVKNILVASFKGGVNNVVAQGTRRLSALQESLQKFMGISKDEVQGVASALVEGGVSVEEMLSKVDANLGRIGNNFVTYTLGLDKMFELAGGTTAKNMTELMRDYGKTMGEAKESITDMLFAGKESGIGTQQFMKNVMEAGSTLKEFGYDIDDVVDITANLQKAYEEIGVPRQFAGRQAALGVKQLAQSVIQMSDDWKIIIGEKLGYGQGLEARQKMMEAYTRAAKGSRGDLMEQAGAMYQAAMKAAEGDEATARYVMEESMSTSFRGADAIAKVGKALAEGDIEQAQKEMAKNSKLLKDAFKTERSKTSQFQLKMNKWLKGLSKIGQGILGFIGDTLAVLVAYLRAIPAFIANLVSMDFDANERLANKLDEFSINTKKHTDKLLAGVNQMGEAAKGFGIDAFGKNLARAFTADFSGPGSGSDAGGSGGQATGGSVVQVVTVPVQQATSGGTVSFEGEPDDEQAAIRRGLTTEEEGWVGGGIGVEFQSVSENGDIQLQLTGNCPRCGLTFGGEDGDMSFMGLEGVGKWSGRDVEAMARVLQKEAGGYRPKYHEESASIAHTLLSRAKRSGGKPGSVYQSATRGHGWGEQGTARPYATPIKPKPRTIDFARKVLGGSVENPHPGALTFFHAKPGDKFSAGHIPKFAKKGRGGIVGVTPSASARKGVKAFFVKPGASDVPEGAAGRRYLRGTAGGASSNAPAVSREGTSEMGSMDIPEFGGMSTQTSGT